MSLAEARRRHPSTRPPVPDRRVVDRVLGLVAGPGVRWPQVATAALQVRGRTGLSPEELAGHLGIDPEVVRSVEAGDLAVEALPDPLRGAVRRALLDAAPRWAP